MNERPEVSRDRAPVFRRELPGGGYVVIGVERPPRDHGARPRGGVEQRKGGGAGDADTPVIAIADGDEQSDGFTELYRLAADNAAVARCLLKWRAERHTEVE